MSSENRIAPTSRKDNFYDIIEEAKRRYAELYIENHNLKEQIKKLKKESEQ